MRKKIIMIFFFLLIFIHIVYINAQVNAQDLKYIQIFDPKQDKVVKVVQLNEEIQSMVSNWIKNIEAIYGKNDPATDDGYGLRVPLDPPVEVDCDSLKGIISEVYIIVPEKEIPFYMIFEDIDKLMCYQFNGDIDKLSEILDFKLRVEREE